MAEPELPVSLRIAADVSEDEYRRARWQHRLLWALTFVPPILPFFLGLWAIMVWQAFLLGGIAVHMALRYLLRDASKMSTQRMKKYKELRIFRAMRAEPELGATQDGLAKSMAKDDGKRERDHLEDVF